MFTDSQIFQESEKQEYKSQVTIIEARNLRPPEGTINSLCTAFVSCKVADQPTQVTNPVEDTNTVTWNQPFTFSGLMLSNIELQKFEILIQVFHQSDFRTDQLIGSFSIGLSTLYNNTGHEYSNQWVSLTRQSTDGSFADVGQLLLSCYLIGAGDKPPVHSINDGIRNRHRDQGDDFQDVGILMAPEIVVKKYQLNINIVRISDLPKMSSLGTNPFVMVKVGDKSLKTETFSNNQKPEFTTRLKFPVQVPSMNDKIVVKVWHGGSFGESFIANIPENPVAANWFNINYLQSTGGNIPFRRVNMYGIPLSERQGVFGKMIASKRVHVEGTEFMGSCLMSMNLIPHNQPELKREHFNGGQEPECWDYALRVDVLEVHLASKPAKIWVETAFGGKTPESSKAVDPTSQNSQRLAGAGSLHMYKFRGMKGRIQEVRSSFTKDLNQVPDIFLNIIQPGMLSNERIGYVRVKPTSRSVESNKPCWYKILEPKDHKSRDSIGSILANVYLLKSDQVNMPRTHSRNYHSYPVKIYCFIYGGYELDPETPSEEIRARAEVRFNDLGPKAQLDKNGSLQDCDFSETSTQNTRHPIFGENQSGMFVFGGTEVLGSIEFAPSISITIKNVFNSKNEVIGTVELHPSDGRYISEITNSSDLKERNRRPPMFLTLKKNGKISGKILAFLGYSIGAKIKVTNDMFRSEFELERVRYNIDFSTVGLRNLPWDISRPIVEFKIPSFGVSFRFIPNDSEEKETQELLRKKSSVQEVTGAYEVVCKYDVSAHKNAHSSLRDKNPNVCKTWAFKGVTLPKNQLYLPRAEIKVTSASTGLFGGAGAPLFRSVNLVEYMPGAFNSEVKQYLTAIGLIESEGGGRASGNGGRGGGDAKASNPLLDPDRTDLFRNSVKGERFSQLTSANSIFGEQKQGKHEGRGGDSKKPDLGNMLEDIDREDLEEGQNQGQDSSLGGITSRMSLNANNRLSSQRRDSKSHNNSVINPPGSKGRRISGAGLAGTPNNHAFQKLNSLGSTTNERTYGEDVISNVYFEELEPVHLLGLSQIKIGASKSYNGFSIVCTKEDKLKERSEKKGRVSDLKDEIKDLKTQKNVDEDMIRQKIAEIHSIKYSYIKNDKVFTKRARALQEDLFDYGGRPLLKTSLEDSPAYMKLPYSKIKLHSMAGSSSTRTRKFNEAGLWKGAIFKGGIRLELSSSDYGGDGLSSMGSLNPQGGGGNTPTTPIGHQIQQQHTQIQGADHYDKSHFAFSIFEQYLLDHFNRIQQIKVRLFLLRANDLAAQTNEASLKFAAGGYNAKSSANPYPYLVVGDGKNDVQNGLTKLIDDKINVKDRELNPSFFIKYELDAYLPGDAEFKVCIKHKGKGVIFGSEDIGIRVVDLEDRFFGNSQRMDKYSYKIRLEKLESRRRKLRDSRANTDKIQREFNTIQLEKTALEGFVKELGSQESEEPIEYCPLALPGRQISQGTLEMLLQVLDLEQARRTVLPNIEPPKPESFEIRLIIWEVDGVPVEEDQPLNVYVRATIDLRGWHDDGISRNTDTHLGCKDGKGYYNYRLLLPFEVPCPFPRVKLDILSMKTLGFDEAIGSVTMRLDRLLKKLLAERKYDSEIMFLETKSTAGTPTGKIKVSFTVVTQETASSSPVGEGQKEPNNSPFLEKPSEGRNIKAYLSSLPSMLNFNFFWLFGQVKYLLVIVGGVIIFWILFVSPGILSGK